MRNVLVTGGTRGLGLAICSSLVADGWHVIASGRAISTELQVLMDSPLGTGRISFFAMDLSRTNEIRHWVRQLVSDCGGLYGLINNAATAQDGILSTMHEKDIEKMVLTNITAPVLLAKYVMRSMMIGRAGRIINIASIIGHTGFSGLSVYGATKASMLGFTKSLAREVGKMGITVNSISPGYMATAMSASIPAERLETIRRRSPLNRLVDVQEVARVVSFLMRDESSSITGADFVVDAGSTA